MQIFVTVEEYCPSQVTDLDSLATSFIWRTYVVICELIVRISMIKNLQVKVFHNSFAFPFWTAPSILLVTLTTRMIIDFNVAMKRRRNLRSFCNPIMNQARNFPYITEN